MVLGCLWVKNVEYDSKESLSPAKVTKGSPGGSSRSKRGSRWGQKCPKWTTQILSSSKAIKNSICCYEYSLYQSFYCILDWTSRNHYHLPKGPKRAPGAFKRFQMVQRGYLFYFYMPRRLPNLFVVIHKIWSALRI